MGVWPPAVGLQGLAPNHPILRCLISLVVILRASLARSGREGHIWPQPRGRIPMPMAGAKQAVGTYQESCPLGVLELSTSMNLTSI